MGTVGLSIGTPASGTGFDVSATVAEIVGNHRLQPKYERLRSILSMGSYQQHALDGASAVDLVVALYDGILRFLFAASEAVERGDAEARRNAVKRALDIIIHLQARLRMDVGGRPAEVLSEFYASIFAQILQASQSASRQKFDHAIQCVKNVRDAWRQVSRDPEVNPASLQVRGMASGRMLDNSDYGSESSVPSHWNA
jgi:flagellar protein FliS